MTSRANAVGQAYLKWLEAHDEKHPNPEDYLKGRPYIGGYTITPSELERAVMRAEHYELIKGFKGDGRRMPLRAHLTPQGHLCLDLFNGDMQAWDEYQRGSGGTVTHNYGDSYSFTDINSSAIVAGSKNVEQHQAQTTTTVVNADLLHRVGLASQELANLVPSAEGAQELCEAAVEVQSTANDPAKAEEAGKAGKRLKAALTAIGTLASLSTLTKFLMDNLDLAVVFQ